jgi:hypothetical protein
VQDAMKCSSTVIKGFLKRNSLFILSTHLYEIAEELKPYQTSLSNISKPHQGRTTQFATSSKMALATGWVI